MNYEELESTVPGFAAARARELRVRRFPFLATHLELKGLRTHQLTLRMIVELEFAENAFFVAGKEPTAADVFQFLWRLNVAFKRQVGLFDFCARRARRRVERTVKIWVKYRRLTALTRDLSKFIADAEQDRPPLPTERKKGKQGSLDAGCHWAAEYLNFFGLAYGYSADQTLDAPIALLNQLYRAWHNYHGTDLPVINRSERLLTRYFAAMRAIAKAKNEEGKSNG